MTPTKTQFTETEALPIAERLADWLLKPESLMIRVAFAEAIKNPGVSSSLLKTWGRPSRFLHSQAGREFVEALQKEDRASIIRILIENRAHLLGADHVAENFKLADSMLPTVRAGLEPFIKTIRLKTGPRSQISSYDYPTLAELGDRLAPLLLFLLQERSTYRHRTLREILEYRQKDSPVESAFLLKHIDRLESVLNDKDLLKRAKKPAARASLVADAMAGAEFGFKPRTSVERTRQGRRTSRTRPK